MISAEPTIRVGILERQHVVDGFLHGEFLAGGKSFKGEFRVGRTAEGISFACSDQVLHGPEMLLTSTKDAVSEIHNVVIGIRFHWQRSETQTFPGNLRFVKDGDGVTVINEVGLEEYLASVISSEMSATSPQELLRAHAITSRSWLVAALETSTERRKSPPKLDGSLRRSDQLILWHDREDHLLFDVCADDHCQRYQGISKIFSSAARDAVMVTRGTFLVYDGTICDARYSKSCGGISEAYEHVWENRRILYLQSVSDGAVEFKPLKSEEDVRQWMLKRPPAYCNTSDSKLLRQVLPSFDQETTDFFRWTVEYEQQELQELLRSKSGVDFGEVRDLIPLERGYSGRLVRLKIEGSRKTMIVGKELEIRKWLSPSHLYSSAFVVTREGNGNVPARFILNGAGWGHGVGLCQIGAAVMAARNKSADEIILHYFRGAELRRLY